MRASAAQLSEQQQLQNNRITNLAVLFMNTVDETVVVTSGVSRKFLLGHGGVGMSTNSVEDRGQRERGCGSSSPLVGGSGGSCNLLQEISFHIVKFS
jgi:hypothetical protein